MKGGPPSRAQRRTLIAAMRKWYDEPDRTADSVAADFAGVAVARDCRSYTGHVLVRAIRRFAGAARRGARLCFGCTCPDLDCHRVLVTELTNTMARRGDYHAVPHPFPDPEIKMIPRDGYGALAVLRHLAGLDGTYVLGFSDD